MKSPVAPERVPKKLIDTFRRVLATADGKEVISELLRRLGHGVPSSEFLNSKEEVLLAQDIAKGIIDLCGMVMTTDGMKELNYDE